MAVSRAGKPLGQTFVARARHLSRIQVLVLASERREEKALEFHLQEVGSHAKEITLVRRTVSGNGWQDFRFEPVSDSLGKAYHFYIVSRAGPEEALYVGVADDNPYPPGRAYGEAIPEHFDLCFQLYYASTLYERLEAILAKKPRPFRSRLFLLAAIAAYNVALAAFLLWIFPLLSSRLAQQHFNSQPEHPGAAEVSTLRKNARGA